MVSWRYNWKSQKNPYIILEGSSGGCAFGPRPQNFQCIEKHPNNKARGRRPGLGFMVPLRYFLLPAAHFWQEFERSGSKNLNTYFANSTWMRLKGTSCKTSQNFVCFTALDPCIIRTTHTIRDMIFIGPPILTLNKGPDPRLHIKVFSNPWLWV